VTQFHGGRKRILLIDDSASTREVLRVALESEGYSVLEAPDGREGARLFRGHRPLVTIVDIVMPDKKGIASGVVGLQEPPRPQGPGKTSQPEPP
jgi:two-component system, chemotaxis family, chemotaxis protein CheY